MASTATAGGKGKGKGSRPEFYQPPKKKVHTERFAEAWRQSSFAAKDDERMGKLDIDESRILPAVEMLDSEAGQKQRHKFVQRTRYRLSRAIADKSVDEALSAAMELHGFDEDIPRDLLVQLLDMVAAVPGIVRFAKVLKLCACSSFHLNEHQFATIIGRLMARSAPHAQVRCALNLGLASDADPLPPVPMEVDRLDEAKACFVGAEGIDDGEASGAEDEAPKTLDCSGFEKQPKVVGLYSRTEEVASGRPVYAKKVVNSGGEQRVYAYFWSGPAEKDKSADEKDKDWVPGWYLGSRPDGGGQTYARCPEVGAALPPASAAWRVKVDDGWKPDMGVFKAAGQKKGRSAKAIVLGEADAEEALNSIDLHKLRGRLVSSRDEETGRYFGHFFVLLHLEHLAEIAGVQRVFGFRTTEELQDFGICLTGLWVEEVGRLNEKSRRATLPGWPEAGSQFVSFLLPRGIKHDCRFRKSESVVISHGNPLKARVAEGMITEFNLKRRRLGIMVNGAIGECKKARFRVDSYVNRQGFERQITALLQFITQQTKVCDVFLAAGVGQVDMAAQDPDGIAKNREKFEPKKAEVRKMNVSVKLHEDEVWPDGVDWSDEEGASAFNPDAEAERYPLPEELVPQAPKGGAAPAEVLQLADNFNYDDEEEMAVVENKRRIETADEELESLDYERLADAETACLNMPDVSDTQRGAVRNAMCQRLTIIDGPPGTGKTQTSVKVLALWAQKMQYAPLLATSDCNIAVDNICEGLMRCGVKVCRVGRPDRNNANLHKVCLDDMVKLERERQRQEAGDLEEDSEDEALLDEPEEAEDYEDWCRQRQLKRRKNAWEQKEEGWLRAKLLKEAEVICMKSTMAAAHQLSDIKFHAILVDDVASATESSSIVPIALRGASQLVLVGDRHSLPPSVTSREAQLRGFSLSLFTRLMDAGVPHSFLDTQYRAHPMLMEFSNASIYKGQLQHGVSSIDRPQPQGVSWNGPGPASFFPCDVEEHLDGQSKANQAEADIIVGFVRGVLEQGELRMEDIGIVTPYKGQVRILRAALFAEWPEAEKADGGSRLEIGSVENFQGREKELILFSAVRNNSAGQVGFLSDWRRLNVMITRARRGLIVVGNAPTLVCDPNWKQWLEVTEKHGGCKRFTVEKAVSKANLRKGKYKTKNETLEEWIARQEAIKADEARAAKRKRAIERELLLAWQVETGEVDAICDGLDAALAPATGRKQRAAKKRAPADEPEDCWDALEYAMCEDWGPANVQESTAPASEPVTPIRPKANLQSVSIPPPSPTKRRQESDDKAEGAEEAAPKRRKQSAEAR